MKNIPQIPIEALGFSVRLYNPLKRLGYKTNHDLLEHPLDELIGDLLSYPNFGKRSAAELEAWFYSHVSCYNAEVGKLMLELASLRSEQFAIEKSIKSIEGRIKQLTAFLNTTMQPNL